MTDLSLTDVLRARRTIEPHLPPTPLWSFPMLNDVVGATVHVKHENTQPTGAFKVRGGITLLAGMRPEARERGVLAFSTGNHAQSIAYAARLFGVPCVIVMPENPNPAKVGAVRALGADVEVHGQGMSEAQEYAEKVAADRGMTLIGVAEPELISGVGTLYLEMFEAVPDLDVLFVPVGGGSGAAAASLVASAVAPRCQVVAVQSESSPAAYDSWRAGACVTRPNRTVVEGLATGRGFDLPQQIMRARLADFVLVSDGEIRSAQRLLLTHAHTLAEGAGAAALAGLLARRDEFAGRRVGIVCTGGNASAAEVTEVLAAADPAG
ncbi:threonine ammonia-lyase [Actinoallomurus sp. CA-150999]|uniref:threonine ammonia-lyase n=1 Tax=Actinoallomurus sp. CA-150999 TaxID=3239887 RepID=UPI003D8DD088